MTPAATAPSDGHATAELRRAAVAPHRAAAVPHRASRGAVQRRSQPCPHSACAQTSRRSRAARGFAWAAIKHGPCPVADFASESTVRPAPRADYIPERELISDAAGIIPALRIAV